MKKVATLFSAFLLTITMAFAEGPAALEYDAAQVNADFSKLNKIEQYVEQNNVTLDELKANHAELVNGVTLSNEANAFAAGELPLDIPAFWWGCVLSVLGVVLVYLLTDQDRDQTKKALYGCLLGAGIWVIINLVARTAAWSIF